MAKRSMGSPNPNKATILQNDPRFEASRTHFSAEGRNALAKWHTAKRNVHMFELFCGLSAMASTAPASGALSRLRGISLATVCCTGAILQRYSYPAPDAGAHFVPGQLRLNGLPPWVFVTNWPARIFLMDLFADVERLHVNFNRADSAAEDGPNGLKELAAECASHIIRDPSASSGRGSNRQFVWNVYQGLWLPGLERSLTIAIDKKESKPQVAEVQYGVPSYNPGDPSSFDPRLITNLEQIGEADNYEWNIKQTLAILHDSKANATAGPSGADVSRVASQVDAAIKGYEVAIETV